MLDDTNKTHTEVKHPQISIPRLADYMAASKQAGRTIVQSCKYHSTARVTQHNQAKAVVTNHILSGAKNVDGLAAKAEAIRNKLADTDFEQDTNDHNADYIDQFAEVFGEIALPGADLLPTKAFSPLMLNGVRVTFRPQFLLRRTTKTNKVKSGALMLRYAKGKPLAAEVAIFQAAAIFGYLRTQDAEVAEAEKALCITLDAYTGKCHDAPGDAIYRFNEMKAACASICEWWPAIMPPKNAIL
jgi:hypothetical protein